MNRNSIAENIAGCSAVNLPRFLRASFSIKATGNKVPRIEVSDDNSTWTDYKCLAHDNPYECPRIYSLVFGG